MCVCVRLSTPRYFEHKNDFWTMKAMQTKCSGTTDLWDTDHPAYELAGSAYEEYLFRDRLLDVVKAHDPTDPLLLFYTPHVAHCPLQVRVCVCACVVNWRVSVRRGTIQFNVNARAGHASTMNGQLVGMLCHFALASQPCLLVFYICCFDRFLQTSWSCLQP